MISLEKWMILTTWHKLPNVGDLGKLITATRFEWLPKVQKIAQSGHTAPQQLAAVQDVGSSHIATSTTLLRRVLW